MLLVCASTQAQDFVYQQLTKSANGLPSNTIYDIQQDQQGFIWIGHDKGLSRYDGVNFRNYNHIAQNGKALTDLREDEEGKIWCQNFIGQVFYVEKDSLQYADFIKPSNTYYRSAMLQKRYLFSAYQSGIRIVDTKKKSINTINVPNFGIGVYVYNDEENVYYRNFLDTNLVQINSQGQIKEFNFDFWSNIYCFLRRGEDWYFFSKVNGIGIFKLSNQVSSVYYDNPQGVFVQNIQAIDSLQYALMTSSGLYILDEKIQPINNAQLFLKNKNITSFFRDRENAWWLGTANDGLIYIPKPTVQLYQPSSSPQIAFTSLFFNPRSQSLYIGSSLNFIYNLKIATNQLEVFLTHPTPHEIMSIWTDTTQEKGQFLFASEQLHQLRPTQNLRPLSNKNMYELDKNHLALANSGSVEILTVNIAPKASYWAANYQIIEQFILLTTNDTRFRAVAGKDSNLYAASVDGLVHYQPHTTTKIQYKNKEILANSLEYVRDTLYAATQNEGILIIHQDKVVEQVLPKQNTAISKLKIEASNIWFITENSVQRYDLHSKQFAVYDAADGLPDAELRDLCIIKDTLYLATSIGLVRFPCNLPHKNSVPPRVIINQVYNNQRLIEQKKDNVFSYYENNVEIHFSVIAFKAGNKAKVWYRINEQDWILLDNKTRTLQLPSLSWGNYNIQIKAFNEDNIESSISPIVSFYIRPPFWLTWWFSIIWIGLLISFFYAIYKYRLNQIGTQNRLESDKILLERELQKSILSSIKSQMNPHFIFNALNTIQAYIYMNDKKNATTYLGKFSDLTRMVLDMSNKETIPLSEELRALQLYIELEKIRFEDTFDCQLVILPHTEIDLIRIPAMIVQPFVENALKHGLLHKKNNRLLRIEFSQSNNNLIVTIDDNGIGRKKAMELNAQKQKSYNSFSTQANQKRLDLLNQGKTNIIGLQYIDKEDAQHNSLGTTVILTIPIQFS